jgi:hypothetical protein
VFSGSFVIPSVGFGTSTRNPSFTGSRIEEVRLGDILYSQESIAGYFNKEQTSIFDVAEKILALPTEKDRLDAVSQFPMIRITQVASQEGYTTLDNRRLFLFKQVLSEDTVIKVQIVPRDREDISKELTWKLTTKTGGKSIRVRGPRRDTL